jgi:hypothetical protein
MLTPRPARHLPGVIPTLLDERSRPDFRAAYGGLVARATRLDVALTHLRLATLDLSEAEVGRLARVRLLLAQVSAVALDAEAHAVLHRSDRAANLRRLATLLRVGRILVRSAPLGGWAPDFSVFGADDGPFAVVVGPHRFDRDGLGGPILASVHGAEPAARALERFEEVWDGAHDIGPAIAGILNRAERGERALEGPARRPGRPAETPTGTRVSGSRRSPKIR